MTLQERLEKLTASEILSKFFVKYLPTGEFGKEIEMLSLTIREAEKAIEISLQAKEEPGISKQQKETIISGLKSAQEALDQLVERRELLLNEKDIIYEAYNKKIYNSRQVSSSPVHQDTPSPLKLRKKEIAYGTPANKREDWKKFWKNKTISEIETGLKKIQSNIKTLEELIAAKKQRGEDTFLDEDALANEQDLLSIITSVLSEKKRTQATEEANTSDQPALAEQAQRVSYRLRPVDISSLGTPSLATPPLIDVATMNSVLDREQSISLTKASSQQSGNAPFDVRLRRTDLFLHGTERIPFSSDEASPILADLVDYAVNTKGAHPGHVVPASKDQYNNLAKNADLYGTLSVMNPYTVTRIYHGLDNLDLRGGSVRAGTNRMLDIRDQKRFYDIHDQNPDDVLNVTNPTTTNIIRLMNNDLWGRTPYSYQDFVFCKYFGRIPNNRMITLRKYAAPTYDNLCWELMGADVNSKLETKFAPVATCVTYFGGDTGNNLSDIFKIKSGLNWGKVKAEIWGVNGDAGDVGTGQSVEKTLDAAIGNFGQDKMGIFRDVFPTLGKISSKTLSLAKFFGMTKSPYAFNEGAANASQLFAGLHDPNTNGPYSNRIQGPLNRIDEVYKREVGIKFENSITLKFAYKAHPIGGINTKAVMLDIIGNLLTMCSATAVFWGGGHRFMIAPREYPWTSTISPGLLKDMYNGKFFGQDGAIRKTLTGFINAGGGTGSGGWNWDNALKALGNLGMGVLGVLSGAVNTLLGSLSGQLASDLASSADSLLQNVGGAVFSTGSQSAWDKGKKIFSNIMANSQAVWRSNALKQSVLPSVQGMRSILIGAPVGNWHLTVGNPLNPIAVIGNLICEDVTFNFGQELGPDDFPDELEATITLQHGMARDLDAIESMFNRGAGRIYQAPDYAKMFAGQISSDQETKVDAVTGGTSARTPVAFVRVDDASALKYAGKNGIVVGDMKGTSPSNRGSSSTNIVTQKARIDAIDIDYSDNVRTSLQGTKIRAAYAGNWATRKMTEG